jgi:RNA polymerase sigma-70 factor, ECF subfamily
MSEDELGLIRRIQQGSANEYGLLVKKYQSVIFNLLLSMLQDEELAKDLTQEVFIRASEKLGFFDFHSRFISWTYRIAINLAISQNRKQVKIIKLEAKHDTADNTAEAVEMVSERDLLIHKAILKLNETHMSVFILRYFDNISYAEIAVTLGITEKKVKSRLFDARKTLKELLEEE